MSRSTNRQVGNHTISLTKDNIVADGKNSTMVYTFPTSVYFDQEEIALAQLQMYYSWENINSTTLNNNVFTYQFPTAGGGYTSHTITIPNGLYEISDINFYLQSQMIASGHYLVNDKSQNVYYLELVISPTSYSVVANMYALPTSLPTGWSNPSSMPFPPATNTTKIDILATNNFKEIIGFEAGTYPATTQTTNQSQASADFTPRLIPNVQPNRNVTVTCSNINNPYANPTTKIYSLAPNVGLGEYINLTPSEYLYNDLANGAINQLRIQFLDKNGAPMIILDSDITINFTIRKKHSQPT
jgi:hypothetical protein